MGPCTFMVTCVVTGGSKGLGLACVTEMLQLGASVLLTARGVDELEAVHEQHSAQHSGRVHILAADVSEASGREALVSRVVELWGGSLDILVNNVGTNKRQRVEDSTEDEYQQMVATNQDSAYFLCKLCLPLLRKSSYPSVVNVSSLAGVRSSGTGVTARADACNPRTGAHARTCSRARACSRACRAAPAGNCRRSLRADHGADAVSGTRLRRTCVASARVDQ